MSDKGIDGAAEKCWLVFVLAWTFHPGVSVFVN
jgi:hypothetical protein